jgi:hypothetical protein
MWPTVSIANEHEEAFVLSNFKALHEHSVLRYT